MKQPKPKIKPRARMVFEYTYSPTQIKIPDGLDANTVALVIGFAEALAEKLRAAEIKYGYSDSWISDRWKRRCQRQLIKHIKKGDPRDVAAYCAFMWHHGWETTIPKPRSIVTEPPKRRKK